jgi:hypothetical protein
MVGPNVGLSCEMVRNGSRGRVSTAVDAVSLVSGYWAGWSPVIFGGSGTPAS